MVSELLSRIHSADDVIRLVEKVGFLPFFANHIPGFSVEECCPKELWFADGVDGPWEWKGPIARSGQCVYGKFFGNKGFDTVITRSFENDSAQYGK